MVGAQTGHLCLLQGYGWGLSFTYSTAPTLLSPVSHPGVKGKSGRWKSKIKEFGVWADGWGLDTFAGPGAAGRIASQQGETLLAQ